MDDYNADNESVPDDEPEDEDLEPKPSPSSIVAQPVPQSTDVFDPNASIEIGIPSEEDTTNYYDDGSYSGSSSTVCLVHIKSE